MYIFEDYEGQWTAFVDQLLLIQKILTTETMCPMNIEAP